MVGVNARAGHISDSSLPYWDNIHRNGSRAFESCEGRG
jgi:hypothetical protein